MSLASLLTLSPSRSRLCVSSSWAHYLSSSISRLNCSRRAIFSLAWVSLWSSDKELKIAHARPRRRVGRHRSCYSAFHSLAAAQTSKHLNRDLAPLSWRGSGRATHRSRVNQSNMCYKTEHAYNHALVRRWSTQHRGGEQKHYRCLAPDFEEMGPEQWWSANARLTRQEDT